MTTIAAASSLVIVLAWQALDVSLQLFKRPDFERMFNPLVEVAYCGISPVELEDVVVVVLVVFAVTGPTFKFETSD